MQLRLVSTTLLSATFVAGVARSQVTLWDWGDQASSQFGFAVAHVGDLDHDGVDDFAVGAPHGNGLQPDSGYVFLLSGRTGQVFALRPGEKSGDLFGWSVAGIDDLDGDGVEDLLIGAPKHEATVGVDRGAAYVLSGETGALIRKHTGTEDGGQLGYSVCRMSDTDHDGTDEYAIGMPWGDTGNGVDTGFVELRSGATHVLLRGYRGENTGDRFGFAIAPTGFVYPGVFHGIVRELGCSEGAARVRLSRALARLAD